MTMSGPLGRMHAALTGRLGVHDPRRPIGPDDLVPDDGGHTTAPRIARFLARDGTARIGVVLESVDGLPRRILDLTARHGLGPGLLDFVAAGGLGAAERELERGVVTGDRDHVTIEREELPDRVLSPVDIDDAAIASGARLVVGFGLTFRRHRAETGGARPFVFPKPASQTMNASVTTTRARVTPPTSIWLERFSIIPSPRHERRLRDPPRQLRRARAAP